MRRVLLCFGVLGICAISRGEIPFSEMTKASLIFRAQDDPSTDYPHRILVYLRLENKWDGGLTWACDSVAGLEAELLDSKGKPVQPPPSAASVPSSHQVYRLPIGSRLDWFIGSGGISMMGDLQSTAALMVGRYGWLLPRDSLSKYSLSVRLRGTPFGRADGMGETRVLFEVPPTPIQITK